MPIPLGVLAVAGAGAGPAPTPVSNAYEWLETVIVGSGGQNSVTFSNLTSTYSSTYQHLQVRAVVRTSRTTGTGDSLIRFNSDSGSNYSHHALEGNGTSVSSYAQTNTTGGFWSFPSTNADTADVFSPAIIDILDPFETSKYTTIRSLNGRRGTSGLINLSSSAWRNTDSVTSITLLPTANDWVQFSRFSLYGLKG